MLNREIDKHKKRVLETLLTYTFIAGIVFFIINLNRELITVAIIELIASILSLVLLYHVKKTITHDKLHKLTIVYLTMFFSIMLFVFSSKGISTSVFVWVYSIPLISYLMLGIRLGFVFTLILYTLSTYIFFKGVNLEQLTTSKIFYGNIFFSALTFWGLSHIYEKTNSETKSKLRKMAVFDKLTSLYNRTMLNQKFSQIKEIAKKNNLQLSLIAFDLDLFKNINDQFGHATGDEVLIGFSKIFNHVLPENSAAFRLGGEEFAVLLPSETIQDSIDVAETIRARTKILSIMYNKAFVRVSVSAGVCISAADDAILSEMMKKADKQLYLAKKQGRDRVVSEITV